MLWLLFRTTLLVVVLMLVFRLVSDWAWRGLSGQAEDAYQAGDYPRGVVLREQALQLARLAFVRDDPRTLETFYKLAVLYRAQGHYGDAEPLSEQALQGYREVLGPHHPNTLASLDNLAMVYWAQGRYGKAEPLLREVLQGQETVGPHDPDTLQSRNNLGVLYQDQGRYGEAEKLYQQALQGRREVLGDRHPDTLGSFNNLATLYNKQGRYGEAEKLYQQALQGYREVLGDRHPNTLASLDNLATLYLAQGRYGEAEPLLEEALQGRREVLGDRHPGTLGSFNNLAMLYDEEGRLSEAEKRFQLVLQGRREVLGDRHPDTLTSFYNLGALYWEQGRYGEAEPLLKEALQGYREVLGDRHPLTTTTQLTMVALLVNQSRQPEAVRSLQELEPNLLDRLGQELYSTETGMVRRQLVSSQSTFHFQDVVLTLAIAEGSSDARRLAGTVMLRWKGLQGEEEAYLARLARRSQDPCIRALADEVSELRGRLNAVARSDKPGVFETALRALEAKQLALSQVSRDYKDHQLRVRTANLDDLGATLPVGTVLIEFRQFQPVDFRTGNKKGDPRLAALLLARFDEPVLADLGPLAEVSALVEALLAHAPSAKTDEAAVLYQRLFAPFESRLAAVQTVYLVPDGPLHLIPYSRLKLADGRYWEERQEAHILQSGRDLLRADPDTPPRGLLALGGIDFEAMPTTTASAESAFVTAAGGQDLSTGVTRTVESIGRFNTLPATAEEVAKIRTAYTMLRKDEPAEVWMGADASEARLKGLKAPPRVLHLATHGFYLPGKAPITSVKPPEPMLFSGVALAGANRALATKGDDGILFAVEAQGLNLEGSELVVLSACDTAKGTLDYSEGVYGLVRGLRIAGARNVLVTLWPVNDGEARDFMVAFYRTWLSQAMPSDPAKALRATRLTYLNNPSPELRDPRIWAPYVLIE